MSANFSFSFSGDDIEAGDEQQDPGAPSESSKQPATPASAFPVAGRPLLPATYHDTREFLSALPSKISYDILAVELDDGVTIELPRRELWDVRVQLMAEDDGALGTESGLGTHDVKTGVYEGGFKSWESSLDLVKTLAPRADSLRAGQGRARIIELGCGTALPSLALFRWASKAHLGPSSCPLSIVLADYNPTVLQLVTLPNLLLTWALLQKETSPLLAEALSSPGELDISPEITQAFEEFLSATDTKLHFVSGAWSPEFVDILEKSTGVESGAEGRRATLMLGAETIYSPFALDAFTQTIFSLMRNEKAQGNTAECLVGAKRLYFGVGGSLDDFVDKARGLGSTVSQLREETEGVRRGVVHCELNP